MEQLSLQLSEAISESEALGETLDAVRQAGYSVYLLLDCKPDEGHEQEPADSPLRDDTPTPDDRRRSAPAAEVSRSAEVAFRIDAKDLAFLRALGIDPTRRSRGRRALRS
jgi:hypothetical protein